MYPRLSKIICRYGSKRSMIDINNESIRKAMQVHILEQNVIFVNFDSIIIASYLNFRYLEKLPQEQMCFCFNCVGKLKVARFIFVEQQKHTQITRVYKFFYFLKS